jgi:hypothetical protein
MTDEEKQARREIERPTILGDVLERLGSDASEDELYDALVARGYWNEEECEALIQREAVRGVQELLAEIAREREIDLLLASDQPKGPHEGARRRSSRTKLRTGSWRPGGNYGRIGVTQSRGLNRIRRRAMAGHPVNVDAIEDGN